MAGSFKSAWPNEVFMQVVAVTYDLRDGHVVMPMEFGT